MRREDKFIIFGTLLILIMGAVSHYYMSRKDQLGVSIETGSYACTAEVQICPDGTQVGRVAPYCHFSPCP